MSKSKRTKQNKFCALGSLYQGEKPRNLRVALQSLLNQSLAVPVVLVIDGPISSELRDVVKQFANQIYRIIELPENVGLGPALNEGIKIIDNEFDYLIRFDTDDINASQRFETLIGAIERSRACLLYTSPSPRD